MCVECCKMEELINTNNINLKAIEELIQDNVLELYAGNCLTEEILAYIYKGNHYTINNYYKCKHCGKYYYIGFCLYGNPIIKDMDYIDVKQILRLEWGKVGTYFSDK